MASWTVWEQQFRTYLAQFRSNMCYAPLSYIIRKDPFPTEAQMQAPLVDIDTTLVETLSFANPYYHDDSRRVYVLLKYLTLTGPGWVHILNYDTHQDGRGAWVTLKAQAEGPAALEQRKQVAYSITSTLKFSGYSRQFTFDDYILSQRLGKSPNS
jgi:hypothetical protein